MEAIEFIGKKAANGIIKIPKEVQAQLHDEFRVIILQNSVDQKKNTPQKKRALGEPKKMALARDILVSSEDMHNTHVIEKKLEIVNPFTQDLFHSGE